MSQIDFKNESLKKLLWKLALPMMIAFLVQALYNTVDAIFVGHYAGNEGIAALGVSFPLQLMLGTISTLFAAGGASLISIALGKKQIVEARKVATIQFILGMGFTAIFTVLSYIYLTPILVAFGGVDIEVLNYAKEYMFIVLAGSLFVGFSTLVSFVMRSQGLSKASMMIMLVGAFINIVFDPIFVFTLNLGVAGAAYATVIAQLASFLLAIYYMFFIKHDIQLTKVKAKEVLVTGKEVTFLGLSSFVGTMMFSLVLVVSNRVLSTYGDKVDQALFATIIKITQLLILPIFGLVSGMQPIVGYNYGAHDYKRVKEVYRLTLKYVFIIMFTGSLIIVIFPAQVLSIFSKDPISDLMPIRLSFIGFVGAGIVNTSFSYLQSLGMKWTALMLSFLRQVILYIPIVLILAPMYGTYAVWFTLPIADIVAMFITLFVAMKAERKLLTERGALYAH